MPVEVVLFETYTVNTTTICDAMGFKGKTPLLVTFKNDVIVKVEPLGNAETPNYFALLNSELFPKYKNLKIKDSKKVDAVSGATFSSNAVKANIEAAINYYQEHKGK